MKLLVPILLIAASVRAGTIGNTDTTIVLHQGDSVAFQFLTWNFGVNAARFSRPVYPTDVYFTIVSAAVDSDVKFSAWLESPDGEVQAPFTGPLFFTPGLFFSSLCSGPVSTLSGYLHLDTATAVGIFSSGSAVIRLVDDGADTTLGLPPDTLQHDLRVSLGGGTLSVGALPEAAKFQANAPEPSTLVPVLALLAAGRRRAGRYFAAVTSANTRSAP
jgi:hypothetical protein